LGFLLLVLVLPVCAQPQTAASAPTYKNLSIEELSTIEVTTPSREPVRAFQTAAAVFVITGDDIRRSGATTLPEALRLAPGVEVARIDANRWSIGIRGFGSRLARSVLVLIDGRTVYTPLFAGTYWEVQDTLLEDVDRVEVIRGPGGTIWGPNAINGVINIITKPAHETRGAYTSVGGGNEEQGFVNSRYGGGNDRNIDYRVYGKAFTRGPEFHPDGHNFDDWRGTQGGFRLDWTAGQHDSVTVQGDLYSIRAGELVTATTYNPPASPNVAGNADLSGGNFMARWTRTFSHGGDLQVQAYYDRTSRTELNLADYRNTYDIDIVSHVPLGARQTIALGAGVRASAVENPTVVSGLTFNPASRTDTLYSAFFQDQISVVPDRLSIFAGVKVLKTNFTGALAEPSARLLWTPNARQSIWAAFTHAVRTPSDVEEDFYLSGFSRILPSGVPQMARFNANNQFAPEQMNGVELGYRQQIGRSWMVDLSSFYNHYHDIEDQEITGAPFPEDNPPPFHFLLPAQFRNGLRGYTKGFEIAPEVRPAGFWRLRGSYSYLHMNLGRSPGSGDIGTFPFIVGSSPHHQVAILSSFDISRSVQADLTYRYVSSLLGIPSYSTGDARLAWRFTRSLELSVAGRNLLQPRHIEFAGDPATLVGIRRSGYLCVAWRR